MTETEAFALVEEALAKIVPGRATELQASLDLPITDLGIDSVATLEMVGVIEDRLHTTFADEDLAMVETLRDLVDLVLAAI